MSLDPQAAAFLSNVVEPDYSTYTPQDYRASVIENVPKLAGVPEPIHRVTEYAIPVENGEIKARLYIPEGKGPFPVFVYFHGGGWIGGDLDCVDVPCRRIAIQTRCIVASVTYRLAPEYRFPVAVNDCYTAVRWVAHHASQWGGDPERIAVGGDSAGGNLATVTAMKARDEGGPRLVGQVLIYPVTDLSRLDRPSMIQNGEGYFLTREKIAWTLRHYLQKEEDRHHIYASPLLAKDLRGLPPAFIITAQYDPLRDEGAEYADRLKEAGVPVTYSCYEGMIHGFFWMSGIIHQAKRAYQEVSDYLRAVYEQIDS